VATTSRAGESAQHFNCDVDAVLLDRLVRQEREGMRLVAALAPSVTFDDVFDLYRDSGFLYAAKLEALAPVIDDIYATWKRALAADSGVLCFVARRGLLNNWVVLRNAICAYAYAPRTWHAQHLVSRERGEYSGTLAVLVSLTEQLPAAGAAHVRLSFRPNNPAVAELFGSLEHVLSAQERAVTVVDYGTPPANTFAPSDDDSLGIEVRALQADEAAAARDFYRQVLDPVELASLGFEDVTLSGLDNEYRAVGLTRRRAVLLAVERGEPVGACIVNRSSPGINFSLLENAIEYLRVRPDLDDPRRRRVWTALAQCAVADVRARAARVVVALDPGDRDLSVPAGLVAHQPRQYAFLTVCVLGEAWRRSIEHFVGCYRRLLAAQAQR
jgi:hypothetical protein